MCEYSRLTVKTARETVDSMKQYEDLYSRRGGGMEASLDLHAKMSLVMTLSMRTRGLAIPVAQYANILSACHSTQVVFLRFGIYSTEATICYDWHNDDNILPKP